MTKLVKKLTFTTALIFMALALALHGTVLAALPETQLFDEDSAEEYPAAHDTASDVTYDIEEVSIPDTPIADLIFMQWEKEGYPDDIGGVYFDSELGVMGVLVVNPTPERMDELRATFSDQVVFTPSAFSRNELRLAQDEINSIMTPDSGIFSTGTGWTSTDGRVHGFGESGKEFRLIVGVDESVFEHYREGFAQLYGDRVVVQISDPIMNDSLDDGWPGGYDLDGGVNEGGSVSSPITPVNISVALAGSAFFPATNNSPESNIWLWAVLAVGVAGTLLLLMRLRTRPTHAKQTANGGVVAEESLASEKQVVDAVRNSAIAPRDDLFDSIIQKIDVHQKRS